MVEFVPVEIGGISDLRLEYLGGLSKFQDLFLELMVHDAVYHTINIYGKVAGYAIIHNGATLIEWYVAPKFFDQKGHLFRAFLGAFQMKEIYCKSFDLDLLSLCSTVCQSPHISGLLYREYSEGKVATQGTLQFRYAEHADLPFLNEQEDEVFEPRELLPKFIADKAIILATLAGVTIGCGFLTKIHPGFDFFDLGFWVHPNHRRQGFATEISLYLKKCCMAMGGKPICGCDVNNLESQRTLAKAGFVGGDRLLEFRVGLDTAMLKEKPVLQ